MKPEISIVLGVYNGGAYLGTQLDSLLAQQHQNFEIIASDDASTDESLQLLQSYAARDPRLKVLVQPRNLGFTANFAAAFSACRGDLICPSDQDDLWHPSKLQRLQSAIGDADLVYCDSALIDEHGKSLGFRLSDQRGMSSGRDPLVYLLSNCASGHAMLFRRQLLERALPIPDGQWYDWWLALTAVCGAGVTYLDEPLVQFRRHGTTTTSLGGARADAGFHLGGYLRERLQLVQAMLTRLPLQAEDQRLLVQMQAALQGWLDEGRRLPLLCLLLRHHRRLLYPLRPRLRHGLLRVVKSALKA